MHHYVSSPRQALSSRDRLVAASPSRTVAPVRSPPKNALTRLVEIGSSRHKVRARPQCADHVTSWGLSRTPDALGLQRHSEAL